MDRIFETKYLMLTKVSIDVGARLLEIFSIFISLYQQGLFTDRVNDAFLSLSSAKGANCLSMNVALDLDL